MLQIAFERRQWASKPLCYQIFFIEDMDGTSLPCLVLFLGKLGGRWVKIPASQAVVPPCAINGQTHIYAFISKPEQSKPSGHIPLGLEILLYLAIFRLQNADFSWMADFPDYKISR